MAWYVTKENGSLQIRNSRTKKRYPRGKYPKEYPNISKEELQRFCDRLNGRVSKQFKLKLAYIPPKLLEEFRSYLLTSIPNQGNAKSNYFCLQEYCLDYFVNQCLLPDVMSWKEHETQWGQYLLSLKKSPSTIRTTVQVTNRFLSFIHGLYANEYSLIILKPYSRARFKHYCATWKMAEKRRKKLISEEQIKKLPKDLQPYAWIGLLYGLRRSEIGGLRLEDVRKGHLNIERQWGDVPLKGREKRQCPHWFSTPDAVYTLISKLKPMHPSTLGHKMKEAGIQTHDLRRTFITKALDVATPKQVMLAVGHANIETTMRYLQDDRELDNEPFVPVKAS